MLIKNLKLKDLRYSEYNRGDKSRRLKNSYSRRI